MQRTYTYLHRYTYAQSSHTPVVAQQHYTYLPSSITLVYPQHYTYLPTALHLFTHCITLIYPAALRKLHSNFAISYTRAPHLFTQQHYTYLPSSITLIYPATLHLLFTHCITLIYPAALRKLHSNFAISYTRAPHLFTQQHYTHLRSNVTLT